MRKLNWQRQKLCTVDQMRMETTWKAASRALDYNCD